MSKRNKLMKMESHHLLKYSEEIPLFTIYKSGLSRYYVSRNTSVGIKQIKGKVGCMCPHCFNVFLSDIEGTYDAKISSDIGQHIFISNSITLIIDKCPYCKETDIELKMLDIYIAFAVSILNKKGFEVEDCSVGYEHENPLMYLVFKDRKILDYVSYIQYPWEIDLDDLKKYNKVSLTVDEIYYSYGSIDYYRYSCDKFDALNALYAFACGLPSLNKGYKTPKNTYEEMCDFLYKNYEETKEEGD